MKYKLLLLISFMFISCGKRFVTGDKYPEIPVIPKHTNKNINIKLFTIMKNPLRSNKYLYGIGEDKLTNRGKGLLIYDEHFNLFQFIKKESKDIRFFSDSLGNIYIYIYTIKRGPLIASAYKVESSLLNKKYLDIKSIPHVYMSDDFIMKKYKKELSTGNNYLGKYFQTKKLKLKELRFHPKVYAQVQKMKKNLKCINRRPDYSISLPWSFLFEYPDKNIIVNTYNIDFFSDISECKNNSTYHKSIVAKAFDHSVTQNVNIGYYNLGIYTPFGFDYIKLKIGSEVFKTKVNVRAGVPSLYIVYQDDDKIILVDRNEYHNDVRYYIVTKK